MNDSLLRDAERCVAVGRFESVLSGRRPFLLDTAAGGGLAPSVSLCGSEPLSERAGWLRDGGLRAYYKELVAEGAPGMLVGTVDFDGWTRFAHYPNVHTLPGGPRQVGREPHDVLRFEAPFHSSLDMSGYCRIVEAAQEHIAAGDIYQVNLAHRFASRYRGDPRAFYPTLRRLSPAPYAAFLDQGSRVVVSSSPECFLRMRERRIVTMPIKGTRPRGRDAAEDRRYRRALTGSEKERAELLMITDLLRNDLGQVCSYGTVAVRELFGLRLHAQVMHLVSTVEGLLREEEDHVSALSACFPGGSITGAPKRRAMEILEALEQEPRGLYTGAIGYFDFEGRSEFSIAIRTMIFEKDPGVGGGSGGVAHFHVGAGIVADSSPPAEYGETLAKARGLLAAAECHGAAIPMPECRC